MLGVRCHFGTYGFDVLIAINDNGIDIDNDGDDSSIDNDDNSYNYKYSEIVCLRQDRGVTCNKSIHV